MRTLLLNVLLAGVVLMPAPGLRAGRGTVARQDDAPKAPEDRPVEVTLPVGTVISIRIADSVNSSHNHPGDLVTGTVDPSVLIANHVVIPRGTEAHIHVMEDKKGGRLHGKAAVRLELVALVLNQEKQDVTSDDYGKHQGALAAKAKGEASAGARGGIRAAASATPEVGAADPIIAIFRPAKVELPAGTRIPFMLTESFTFGGAHDAEESSTKP